MWYEMRKKFQLIIWHEYKQTKTEKGEIICDKANFIRIKGSNSENTAALKSQTKFI